MRYLTLPPATTSPAKLARMSMAIPAFFDPVVCGVDPVEWKRARFMSQLQKLRPKERIADYRALGRLTFIDGGVFANLPSDAFVEVAPGSANRGGAIVAPKTRRLPAPEPSASAARRRDRLRFGDPVAARAWDAYLRLHRSANSATIRTAPIDTGEANWLNFVMSEGEKIELFVAGVEAAET
ncbi:MAG: hypothetical protein R3D46_10125 [Defluviimonas denitrificans]